MLLNCLSLSRLQTSVKMKLLCVQVVKQLLGSEIDVSYSCTLLPLISFTLVIETGCPKNNCLQNDLYDDS